MSLQWYPGHIAKWDRQLDQSLRQVDVVLEVRDARLPLASANITLAQRCQHKPRVVVLNKAELADPSVNRQWLQALNLNDAGQGQTSGTVLLYDAHLGKKYKPALLTALQRLAEPLNEKQRAKGLKPRPLRLLIVGMPNVGKSSIINNLVGQKRATTGHKAGVTRQTQWVRIHPLLDLLDSPGVLPPRLDDPKAAVLLACVSSIGEAAFDAEPVATQLLGVVEQEYPGLLAQQYELPSDTVLTLEAVGRARHWLGAGGEVDLSRTAQQTLKDFRSGRWGRLSLEWPTPAATSSSSPALLRTSSQSSSSDAPSPTETPAFDARPTDQ